MHFTIEHEREEDGRWLAEVPALPCVLAYGATAQEAMAKSQAPALHPPRTSRERRDRASADLHRGGMTARPSSKAHRVLATLYRIGRTLKRQSGLHKTFPEPTRGKRRAVHVARRA